MKTGQEIDLHCALHKNNFTKNIYKNRFWSEFFTEEKSFDEES